MNAYELIQGLFSDLDKTITYLDKNKSYLENRTNIGETILHYCVIENRINIVEKLIQMGAEVNVAEFSMNTPLMHAVQLGYNEMAVLLLNNSADVDLRNNNNETALSISVASNNKFLFDKIFPKCRNKLQYYFSDLDAMEIVENPNNDLKKIVLNLGIIDPFDSK